MTLPALASIADLETRLGQQIAEGDQPQAEWLLNYASSLVRSYAGRTWTVDDALVDVPDGVREVTVEVVFRAITNPTGVTQDTVGPWSVSFGADAAQRMYLSKSDKVIISGRQRAFTIDPTPADSPFSDLDWEGS